MDVAFFVLAVGIAAAVRCVVDRRTESRLLATLAGIIALIGVSSGLNRVGEPMLRAWINGQDLRQISVADARVAMQLQRIPLYAILLKYHPESFEPLVRAARKSAGPEKDAIVGQIELGAVIGHYLGLYLPTTSDRAAMEFAMATRAIIDQMFQRSPQLCIDLLRGDTRTMAGRLPMHVFERFATASADVIGDAIAAPQPAPDLADIEEKRERVAARMTRDGNPLATDPQRLMNDPQRACFAMLAIFDAVSKSVPQNEIAEFVRGVIPLYLGDEEA